MNQKIFRNLKLFKLCLPVFILLSACSTSEIKESLSDEFCLEDFKSEVEITEVKPKTVSEGIHLTGTIEVNPDQTVEYLSLLEGVILKTNFALGDRVYKGQVLAEMRSPELTNLSAELKTVIQQIKVAERQLVAAQSMYEDSILSEREWMEVQSDLNILQAEKNKLKANLNLYNAYSSSGVFQIKSPVDGVITHKTISPGTSVTENSDVLFSVSDMSEVWAVLDVYSLHIQHIEVGMEVDIKVLAYPDQSFSGRIHSIAHAIDEGAKVMKARVVLTNTDRMFKPGMMVDVMVYKHSGMSALSVPESALVFDNDQNHVLVYKNDCDIELRKIEMLSKDQGVVYIKEGLKEGERIITKNHLLIYEALKQKL